MKLPRGLSGAELIKLLCKHHGYREVNQERSHVILETETPRHIVWQFPITTRFASAHSMPSSAWWRNLKA